MITKLREREKKKQIFSLKKKKLLVLVHSATDRWRLHEGKGAIGRALPVRWVERKDVAQANTHARLSVYVPLTKVHLRK